MNEQYLLSPLISKAFSLNINNNFFFKKTFEKLCISEDIPVNIPGEDKAVQKKYHSMASFFLKLQTFRSKFITQHKGIFDA